MKILLLADNNIKQNHIDKLKNDFIDFIHTYTGLTPEFFIERKDFTSYPTSIDSEGDVRLTPDFIKSITDDIYQRYAEEIDHVAFLIHQDNWQSDDGVRKIWGTNYSNIYNGYQVHICRYDKRNQVNTFGTFYHEVHHSLDALILTYTGTNIAKLIGEPNWDIDITHGRSAVWDYIRNRENRESLIYAAPYLKLAYAKREAIFSKKVGLYNKLIGLAIQYITLLKIRQNQKNGMLK